MYHFALWPFSAVVEQFLAETKDRLHQYWLRVQLPHSLINSDILAGRHTPREILCHAVPHQLLPGVLVFVQLHCLMNRAQQSLTRVFLKLESRPLLGARIPGINGVVE